MNRSILFIALLCPLFGLTQDLTGIWRGYFYEMIPLKDAQGKNIMERGERYKFEVQLDHQEKQLKGVTYSYLQTQFYGKAALSGTFNNRTLKILMQETKMLEVKMMGMETTCIMTCFLQYAKIDTSEVLEGNYLSMNTLDSSNCGRGRVFLKKVATSDFHKEPFLSKRAQTVSPQNNEKAEHAKPNQGKNKVTQSEPIIGSSLQNRLPVSTQKTDTIQLNSIQVPDKLVKISPLLSTRSNPLVKEFVLPPGSVTIKIYDNGTIDNDTVTVFLDNKPILSKKRLTEQAIQYTFTLDKTQPVHELIMVAENLGLYPPNTSLMIIESGEKRFEVRISSNEDNNALVRFKMDTTSQ